MSETVGVIVRPLDEIAAEIEEQLEGGHNAGRSITRKLACEALAALERAEYASRAPREEPMSEERCESCRKVLGRGWKYDSAGEVKLCPRCYAELARTPSPLPATKEEQ